jgi:hypothetical protein
MCVIGGEKRREVVAETKAYRAVRAFDVMDNHITGTFIPYRYRKAQVSTKRPSSDIDAGFWTFNAVRPLLYSFRYNYVFAFVRVWGDVVVHTKGYRSQHMRIRQLVVVGKAGFLDKLVRNLRKLRVPIRQVKNNAEARRFLLKALPPKR